MISVVADDVVSVIADDVVSIVADDVVSVVTGDVVSVVAGNVVSIIADVVVSVVEVGTSDVLTSETSLIVLGLTMNSNMIVVRMVMKMTSIETTTDIFWHLSRYFQNPKIVASTKTIKHRRLSRTVPYGGDFQTELFIINFSVT